MRFELQDADPYGQHGEVDGPPSDSRFQTQTGKNTTMKYAQCDNCGHKDDASFGSGPILYAGAVFQLRSENGGDDFEHELELCEGCREEIMTLFPNLKKALQRENPYT